MADFRSCKRQIETPPSPPTEGEGLSRNRVDQTHPALQRQQFTQRGHQLNALFPTHDDRHACEDLLTRRIAEALSTVAAGPANCSIDIESFREELAAFDFETPRDLDASCEFAMRVAAVGVVPMTHPRYFGLFNPSPAFPAECADRITAALNPQLATWSHAPAAVEVEHHVVSLVAQKLGLGASAGGHFTSGGSEANETALLCALTRACPEYAIQGIRAFAAQPVFYISRESHLAWLKIAHRIGVGRAAARLIETDGHGRMCARALSENIASDMASNLKPVLVAATAGTTNAGMIDPLPQTAAVARMAGLWFHVDAAWGGALIASPALRHELDGIQQADSVTVDAHKWFATTVGAGMFLCRAPEHLNRVFGVSTDYMPSNDPSRDPYVTSALWSRRFVGLRLFLNMAVAGWGGYASHVERAVSLIEKLRTLLRADNWTIVNSSPMAVVNALPPPGSRSSVEIANRVQASGNGWISSAMFEGLSVVRACVTNGRTDEADIRVLCDALNAAAGHQK